MCEGVRECARVCSDALQCSMAVIIIQTVIIIIIIIMIMIMTVLSVPS